MIQPFVIFADLVLCQQMRWMTVSQLEFLKVMHCIRSFCLQPMDIPFADVLTVTKHKTKESTNQSDVRPTIFKSGPGWGSLRGRAGSRLGARPLIYTSTKIFEKIFHMIIFFNKVLDN